MPLRFGTDNTPAPLFFLLAALAVVFTLASLAQKGRGIQDMLAGTWLVPR